MLLQFSMVPMDVGSSLSAAVADVVAQVERSGLPYELHAMGTLVEGDPEELFNMVRDIHLMMRQRHRRVYTTITIDDKVGAVDQLQYKTASVRAKLPRIG